MSLPLRLLPALALALSPIVPFDAPSALATAALAAQEAEGSVAGIVRAADDGEILGGVTVRLEPGGLETITDRTGRFLFRDVDAGTYSVSFALLGRAPESRSVTVAPGLRVEVRVELPRQALRLEQIQVTATRSPRAVTDVPTTIGVVDRAQLERAQVAKVGDVFAFEPGVEVTGVGPFEGRPVVRGLTGNRVLVLVDGQRLNNAREAINFGGVQPALVDVEQIEEVEILRGPASVLYGSDALGGIVNIVTRRTPFPTEGLDVGGNLASTYRTASEGQNVSGNLRLATSNVGLRLGGTWRDAENFESPEGIVPNSGAESVDLSAGLDVRLAEGRHLRIDAQRFRADDVGVAGTGGIFTGLYPFTDRDKVSAEFRAEEVGALGSLRVSGYWQNQEENFSSILDLPPFPAGPFELAIDSESERVSDVNTLGFEVQGETRLDRTHRLTWGLDVFSDDVSERRRETTTTVATPTFPGPPPTTTVEVDSAATTPDATFTGLGIYLQDEIDTGRWLITPGVRFDRFDIESERLERPEGPLEAQDRTEQAVSASLGVLFRATEHVRPTFSVGRAFRTPNVIERFFFGPGSQGGLSVPNPDLDNETSINLDVGVKLDYPTFRGSVTYFQNRVDDFITFRAGTFEGDSTFAGQPISQVQNVGEVRLQGLEASGEWVLTTGSSRWFLSGAFSWTDGEDLEDDEPFFVPPVKGVLGLTWAGPGDVLSLTLQGRAVADQTDVPEGFEATESFTVFDARAALDLRSWIGQDVELRFGISNLTDEAYREPYNATLSPGRNLETSLRYGF